jgi:hypothetical protein
MKPLKVLQGRRHRPLFLATHAIVKETADSLALSNLKSGNISKPSAGRSSLGSGRIETWCGIFPVKQLTERCAVIA